MFQEALGPKPGPTLGPGPQAWTYPESPAWTYLGGYNIQWALQPGPWAPQPRPLGPPAWTHGPPGLGLPWAPRSPQDLQPGPTLGGLGLPALAVAVHVLAPGAFEALEVHSLQGAVDGAAALRRHALNAGALALSASHGPGHGPQDGQAEEKTRKEDKEDDEKKRKQNVDDNYLELGNQVLS